ncbi:MAG: T9SS type A sorting domain-containing protein [Ignavibacteria bacterium]|nr:T9SS type A sorting domain-containing protein [Ignavibacteria bacterium]
MNQLSRCGVASFLLLALFSLTAQAQQDDVPAWDGYDSSFVVGAHSIFYPYIGQNYLGIDRGRYYGATVADMLRQMYTPNGDHERRDSLLFYYADEKNFPIVMEEKTFSNLIERATSILHYAGKAPSFHYAYLDTINGESNWLDIREFLRFTELPRSGSDTLIAMKPVLGDEATFGGDSAYYVAHGMTDSSLFVRLSVAVWTDVDTLAAYAAPGDTIAYALLYRRDTTGQNSPCNCACDFYRQFDTLAVTRAMYEGADTITGGFREFSSLYRVDTIRPVVRGFWGSLNRGDSAAVAVCDSLYGTLDTTYMDRDHGMDFSYKLYSTGLVPVRFLRSSFNQHLFDVVKRGGMDSILRAEIATMAAEPRFDSLLWRISLKDEGDDFFYQQIWGMLSSKIQDLLAEENKTWQVFANPVLDFDSFRLISGDMDTTRLRLIHNYSPQWYAGFQLPELVADTARMAGLANDSVWYGSYIRYNTMEDYRKYISETAQLRYLDIIAPGNLICGNDGANTIRAIDVAKFKFRRFTPAFPVYGNVQVHGNMKISGSLSERRLNFSPPPPNIIRKNIWMTMLAGADGVWFSDFNFNGEEFGPLAPPDFYTFNPLAYTDSALDVYVSNLKDYAIVTHPSNASEFTPYMWVGFKGRFQAIQETIAEIRKIDTLIGWKNLVFNQEQMSVNDTRQIFTDFPLVDTLYARQAQRYSLGGGGVFLDSTAVDARDSTYIELSHFLPGAGDATATVPGVHYLCILNKRTWPIDTLVNDTIWIDKETGDSLTTPITRSRTPLGYIDVRKPVLRLRNAGADVSDSCIIERVGRTWKDTVAYNDLVDLDWHRPGEGGLYRVTPIPSGVSSYGVAYNNAVRSENTADDTDPGYQVTFVERDSAVWVRSYVPGSGWGEEFLVSAVADTARVTSLSRRLAHNILPAVARVRDGEALLVVWQRLDTNDQGTVEALHIAGKPDSSAMANATPLTLSTGRTIDRDWMKMAPAVVGFDGGWIIAWGAPTNGIEVAALRNETVPDVTDDRSNISVVRGQQLSYPSRFGLTNVTVPLDSISMYPTLAYVPNEEVLNEGQSNEQHLRWGHLAWQQGADSSESIQSSGPYIMYKKIGVEWRWDSVKPLLKVNQPVEHVSQSLPGCRFYHPSIAADSLRVGVAFESRALLVPRHIPSGGSIGEIKAVTLRFRDSLKADGTSANARRWSSPAYYWGDSSNFYVYPSLTEFPIKPRADLLNTPEGALAWFNQTDGTSQWSYRYGELLPGSLPDGNYPTMMLAPAVVEELVTQTGVLYREADSFTRARGWGETGTYYPARMITDETYALDGFRDIFTVLPRTSGIHAHLSIGSRLPVSSTPCNFAVVQAGLAFDHVDGGQRDTFTIVPGTFFSPPENGDTWIEDPDDGSKVVRTEAFPAGTITTTIRRYVGRTSDAVTWLNTFPYDTLMLSQPDVKILTELVRVADGTVLWQDDTISVRDMTTDALAEVVIVPTDAVTPSGTMVYTRLRAVPTLDVEYLLSAGFQFYEDNTAWIASPKRSSPWQIEQHTQTETGENTLRVQIIPNPAKDRADVRVTVQNPGTVTVSIWSLLGEHLADLPAIEAETRGIYTVAVDLSNVRPGTYLVKAETNGTIATSRIHVE